LADRSPSEGHPIESQARCVIAARLVKDDQLAVSVNGDPRPDIALLSRANSELQRRFDFSKMAQWFR